MKEIVADDIGYLYCITNVINNMKYYGVVFGKGKRVLDRFKEHVKGKGGKTLFEEGIKKFGESSFVVNTLVIGSKEYVLQLEPKFTINSLWPTGYNRNCGRAIFNPPDVVSSIVLKRRNIWKINGYTPTPPNWKGKKRSYRMKETLRQSKIGHEVSVETRQKISETLSGRKQSEETKLKRAQTFKQRNNRPGIKWWLFISPSNETYLFKGGYYEFLKAYKLSNTEGLQTCKNTGIPVKFGKNKGWITYDDKRKILEYVYGNSVCGSEIFLREACTGGNDYSKG